jgi:type II secretory pathway pseudopilin PulG
MNVPAEAVIAGLGLGAALALPSLFAARRTSNESAAVGNLRTLGSAEATYYSEHNRFATLSELVAAQMLDSGWVNGTVLDGYKITQVRVTKTAFEFKSEPLTPSEGKRSYNITSDYVIRFAEGPTAPQGTKGRALGT